MPWAKFDDSFPDHPKVVAAGPEGMALAVAAVCYSAKHLTDGVISEKVALRLASNCTVSAATPIELIDRMVENRLWDEDIDCDYRVHDYLDYNPCQRSP
jgi:hypothetical protein